MSTRHGQVTNHVSDTSADTCMIKMLHVPVLSTFLSKNTLLGGLVIRRTHKGKNINILVSFIFCTAL